MTMAEVLDIKQGKVTGVIIPPPDIRAVVDKTAQFVARNGKSFEERILASSEGKTAKFSFMKISDPYHAYYEHKIREFEEGIQAETSNNTASSSSSSSAPSALNPSQASEAQTTSTTSTTTVKASITTPIARFAMNKPTEAPHEFEFSLGHPSGITALDLDIIKLAAQYTAVNGREFLAGLAQKEQRNPQFDFLKPTHLLFSYFTSLVDSYVKVLRPSTELKDRFINKSDRMSALECAVQRWEWTRAEEEKKRRENDEANADRLAAIDWSEFAVVETIEFPDDELLETVGLLSLNENNKPVDIDNGDMDIDETSKPKNTSTHRNLQQLRENRQDVEMEEDDGRNDSDIKVISDYVPRIAKSGPSLGLMTMIDPISGKALPVSEMSEHMRVQLLDPKWRVEQQRFQEKQKQTSYAEGSSIADSLQIFARKRGDIFGSDKSQGPDEKKSKIIQETEEDDYKIEQAPPQVQFQAPLQVQFQAPLQVQFQAPMQAPMSVPVPPLPTQSYFPPPQQPIHLPPPSMPVPTHIPLPPPLTSSAPSYFNTSIPPPPPMVMPMFSPAPMSFMPMINPVDMNNMNNNRPPPPPPIQQQQQHQYHHQQQQQLTIVSEEEFVKKYPNPVTLYIHVPIDQSLASWNLNGQQLIIKITVTSTVKELKEIISLQLGGMPTNKQQLKEMNSSTFCKDVETLAKINIGEGCHLELLLKSRGGKR